MTAPATTTRQTPSGIVMEDGYCSKIAFAADPNVCFWEKTVQPPGLDGGEPIDTTTMFNSRYRSKAARSLITMTDSKVKVAYDPNVYDAVLDLVNVNGAITITFPDGSTYDFYGFLRTFEADALEEGKQPEATVTITPSNYDPVAKTLEDAVLTSVEGT